MMQSPSTLHDFVLNLLSDPSLKAAFAADAQGTLEQAGLADITAVDVQEVIPLVIDLLPATPAGVPSLEGVYLHGVAEDVLAEGPLGAISQLQAVASQLTSSGINLSDISTSSAGLLAADESGLSVWAGTNTADTYGAGAIKLNGDFSTVGDVASVLDQTTSPVTGNVLDVADTAVATVDSTAGSATSLVPGTDSILGQLGGVTGLTDGLLGTVGGADASIGGAFNVTGLGNVAEGNIGLKSDDTLGQVEHVAGNVVGTATGVAGTATGVVGDTAGVSGVLGNVTHVADAGSLPVVGDLTDGLLG